MGESDQRYKIKLASGRVLGPIDLERVAVLIKKKQILGDEIGRVYPDGEWLNIALIDEIAELLLANAQSGSTQKTEGNPGHDGYRPIGGSTKIFAGPPKALPGATEVMPNTSSLKPLPELQAIHDSEHSATQEAPPSEEEKTLVGELEPLDAEDKTEVGSLTDFHRDGSRGGDEGTEEDKSLQELEQGGIGTHTRIQAEELGIKIKDRMSNSLSFEKTVVFQRPGAAGAVGGLAAAMRSRIPFRIPEKVRGVIAAIGLIVAMYSFFYDDAPKTKVERVEMIRPSLPSLKNDKPNPKRSQELYLEAMKVYVLDHVIGYRDAAKKLHQAIAQDPGNVQALAMLASSYLNLIDSSNKDENYFSVIQQLIQLSRAKGIDLPETVIADVEFYIAANKPEAAQNRIIAFTANRPNFGLEMFYYLALSFYSRGIYPDAARYVAEIPDNKAFSSKLFLLRGMIAEKLGDTGNALQEYQKAIRMNPAHLKSRIRLADLSYSTNRLKETGASLEYTIARPSLLSPADLARAYFLYSKYQQLYEKWDLALGNMERAVRLTPGNHDYLLELYQLRAKVGDSVVSVRQEARMYFFLSEGEKLVKAGRYQDALTQFLQARQAMPNAALPLVKIGDMFTYLHDLVNARLNYRLAAERSGNNIEIWSKLLSVLIQSYEWEEASHVMDRFRNLPVPQSAIDRAAADMFQKQSRYQDAQLYYRKAMQRDIVDTEVYLAYANSLMATKNYAEAPFFYALALRFDPLNIDAVVGTAKAIASGESIEKGIGYLRDELQKNSGATAEYLTAIAELQIQKGDNDLAQRSITEAMQANPDYAGSWRVQAQIYMSRETQRGALDKALDAYKSYSDRNSSDPSGYLERYKIFVKRTQFDKASEELGKIFALYPKYPNLAYYQGYLFGLEGNHKEAVREYLKELKTNPTSVNTMMQLGREYLELGSVQDALQLFNQAMIQSPKFGEAKQMSGWANYLLKNFQGAVALYQAALVYDPQNPVIYKRMGLAYLSMGDQASAAQAFRKYLQMEPDAPDKAEFERFR